MRNAISAAIMTVILRSGYSQSEFGRRIGISQTTVSQWMTGRTIPSIKSVAKIKAVYPNLFDWNWFIGLYSRKDSSVNIDIEFLKELDERMNLK